MRAEALKDLLRVLPRDSPARVGARTRAWARCFECAEVRAFVRACVRARPTGSWRDDGAFFYGFGSKDGRRQNTQV